MDFKKILLTFILIFTTIQSFFIYHLYNKIEKLTENKVENKILEHAVIEVQTSQDLQNILEKRDRPAVIFFHMENCGWCKKAAPIYYELVKKIEFAQVDFYSVDGKALQAPFIVQKILQQNIQGFPTFFLMNQQGFVDKIVGFKNPEELEQKIKETLLKKNQNTFANNAIELNSENQKKLNNQQKQSIIEIKSEQELRQALERPQGKSIIFFHMTGCGWCKKAEPIFQEIAQNIEFNDIKFYSANSKQVPVTQLAQNILQQKVTGFPTFFFLNENGYVEKQVGFINEEDFKAKIKNIFALKSENEVKTQAVLEETSEKLKAKKPATQEEKEKYMNDFLDAAQKFADTKKYDSYNYEKNLDEAVKKYNSMYIFSTHKPLNFTSTETEKITRAKAWLRDVLLEKKNQNKKLRDGTW